MLSIACFVFLFIYILILILFHASVPPSCLPWYLHPRHFGYSGKTSILIDNSTGTEQLAYITSSSVCVFLKCIFFLHIHAFSRSSDGNEAYEYACDPRAFCTEARCRCSFPSRCLFLLLVSQPLPQSLTQSNTLDTGRLPLSHESTPTGVIHKEYSMWRWKFIRQCTKVWRQIKDKRVFGWVHVCDEL